MTNGNLPIQKEQVKRVRKTVSLLLCNSCYWCATALDDSIVEGNCPSCMIGVESIPLNDGEMFSYDYSTNKGVILEFRRRQE